MRVYRSLSPHAPCLVLAHGAGAGEGHPWMQRTAQGLADRGVTVVTFDFPYRAEGRKIPDPGPILEGAFRDIWREIQGGSGPESDAVFFAGGKSMGGRIASQVAAAGGFTPAPAALIFFGYPLHPPAKPGQRRDRHLPSVEVPMLFLHGTRDPFGSPEEMQTLSDGLPRATLALVDGGDHSLHAPKRQDPTGRSLEGALDVAAGWIAAIARAQRR